MKQFFKHFIKRSDFLLLTLSIILSSFSLISIYSICNVFFSNNKIFIVQIVSSLIGLIGAFIISTFDYHSIAKLWKLYLPISIFFVLLTFFIGSQRGTADDKAWIMLPFGISFQPSEFLKITFILSFSLHLNYISSKINKLSNIILLLFHGAFPILLTHLQGDDGTALIFIMIFAIMIFSSGISWKYISLAIISIIIMIPITWFILNPDQKKRILITMHPENDPTGIGYQQLQGLISICQGNLFGKGFFKTYYKYVPELQNDFIFSFICQAVGWFGSIFILLLLLIMLLRILNIALKSVDSLGRFISIGVFSIIFSQIILNIGMNLSLSPVIGVTLPFLSAGGSSVITSYLGIGLALSVYNYNNKTLFFNTNKL